MAIENLDPNLLEERLAGDYQVARRRVGEFSEAVGIAEPRGSRAERRLAKGIRIKGNIIGQKELAEIDLNLQNLVDDLSNQTQFTNIQQEADFKIQQTKAFNKFREELMAKGLYMEQQMQQAKLKASEIIAMNKNFSDLAEGIGFTFALKGMGGTTNADKMAMHKKGLSQGNMADLQMLQDGYYSNY